MPIQVVLHESEDDTEVFSAGGNLGPGGSGELMHDLNGMLGSGGGGSSRQILLNVAAHLIDNYPGSQWSIKVERWDGEICWLSFEGLAMVPRGAIRQTLPEPITRVSRYEREPVI